MYSSTGKSSLIDSARPDGVGAVHPRLIGLAGCFSPPDVYARDGRRFTVLADERLTAFLELERVTGVTLGERAN